MKIGLYLLAIIVFSQIGNIVKFSESHALVTTFWRLLFSACLVIPLIFATKGFTQIKELSRKHWLSIIAASGFLFVTFTVFILAVEQTTVAQATILFSMHPLFTAVLGAIFLAEPLTKRMKFALGMGLTGVVVLFNGNVDFESNHILGSIFALIAAVSFSSYLSLSKTIRKDLNNVAYTGIIYSLAAVLGLGTLTVMGMPFVENSDQSWTTFIALALFPTLLGHALFTYLLKHLNINFVSCGILAHPPLAAISAHYLFGEIVTTTTIIGFVLTSIALASLLMPYELIKRLINRSEKESKSPINEAIKDNFEVEIEITNPNYRFSEANTNPGIDLKKVS